MLFSQRNPLMLSSINSLTPVQERKPMVGSPILIASIKESGNDSYMLGNANMEESLSFCETWLVIPRNEIFEVSPCFFY